MGKYLNEKNRKKVMVAFFNREEQTPIITELEAERTIAKIIQSDHIGTTTLLLKSLIQRGYLSRASLGKLQINVTLDDIENPPPT